MSGMPKYPFRKRKTQCSLLPGISDLTHQEKLESADDGRQRILSPLSSLTSCSSKMASICCARLQIWIAKSIVLIPLEAQKEDANIAMQQRGKTREKCKAREGEKFSQPRTHEPCHVAPLRMRESASPRSGGLSHRRPSCNATRMPGLRIPLACSCRSHCSTTDRLRLSLTKRAL